MQGLVQQVQAQGPLDQALLVEAEVQVGPLQRLLGVPCLGELRGHVHEDVDTKTLARYRYTVMNLGAKGVSMGGQLQT